LGQIGSWRGDYEKHRGSKSGRRGEAGVARPKRTNRNLERVGRADFGKRDAEATDSKKGKAFAEMTYEGNHATGRKESELSPWENHICPRRQEKKAM